MKEKLHHQLVGNTGLFYVCYELSKRGWNVMPTSRNARGIDIVIYNHDASETHTIQVKSLSKRYAVPLGSNIDNLIADYLIICRNVLSEKPDIFIAEINKSFILDYVGKSTNSQGITSYWIEPPIYEEFKEDWDSIGQG